MQSRLMSLVEATTNVVVGFHLALLTQIVIFPLFSLAASVADNLLISGIFTAASVVRSFILRRLFEAVRVRHKRLKAGRSTEKPHGRPPSTR
jgi:hypothetical protein